MFTTFVGVSPRQSSHKDATSPAPRPKRSQVHLDKAEFQLHYESLWSEPSLGVSFRKPSPLVDIVLALCIQYGAFRIGGNEPAQSSPADVEDSRLTGRIYFQRCHALLSEQNATTTAPSIMTVQCHAYSVQYLLAAGQPNTAYAHLATAMQTAHATGLHHEPPAHLPSTQKELRRRLWWKLYTFDATTSLALGRPHLTHLASASVRLPSDSPAVAHALGPCYVSPAPDVTWLSFHSQSLLLVDAARAVQAAFADRASPRDVRGLPG
ncbi:putative fungal specific transcription factor domain-containing protein [Diplodia seriata]|uniref:Putative fungal specific transcription factor domain-containing protein n=1 Tax=Diplodia seriata TaxID=420778 RepID=A0A0G2GJ59_9PEZI|nr:putative fungal specific transcription factor domain-containing protein [Diplodia seriata]